MSVKRRWWRQQFIPPMMSPQERVSGSWPWAKGRRWWMWWCVWQKYGALGRSSFTYTPVDEWERDEITGNTMGQHYWVLAWTVKCTWNYDVVCAIMEHWHLNFGIKYLWQFQKNNKSIAATVKSKPTPNLPRCNSRDKRCCTNEISLCPSFCAPVFVCWNSFAHSYGVEYIPKKYIYFMVQSRG